MKDKEDLQQALRKLDTLPAIPDIALQILALNLTAGQDNDKLLELIAQDPPIMSKIIGLSNAPVFNRGRVITRLDHAVAFLGFKRVKMIALSFSIISSVAGRRSGELDFQRLWDRSMAFTVVMDTLAGCMPKRRRPPDEDIYLAGLLHCIGLLVLDFVSPQLSDLLHLRLKETPDASVDEVENELLGMSHGEIGAIIAKYWNLPGNIVESINNRQVIVVDQDFDDRPLVVLTNIAEKLIPALDRSDKSEYQDREIAEADWRSLGIEGSGIDEARDKVQKTIREIGMSGI